MSVLGVVLVWWLCIGAAVSAVLVAVLLWLGQETKGSPSHPGPLRPSRKSGRAQFGGKKKPRRNGVPGRKRCR